MITNGEWEHKTLEAIASEAGFNNRNTFTTAFKKETGQNPFEYLKEVKGGGSSRRSLPDEVRMKMVV